MILQGTLEKQIIADALEHEGCIPWPYCDVKGFVTIGVGHLLSHDGALLNFDMYHEPTQMPATDTEKRHAWHACKAAYDKRKGALYYKSFTDVRITRDTAMQLCGARLANEFMPAVAKACPQVAFFPEDAIRALVDIAYNVGIGFAKGFPSLIAACNKRDWTTAAKECTRADARRAPTKEDPEGLGPRNRWTIARFEAAREQEDGAEFNRSLGEHT
jgi:GH24 family phage-related lysozyme (muramidase)